MKGNSASLITQDLINQSLILQELETPPGWDYHSGSACTMKSIKHIKMYKCWLWPQASVLSCPLTAVPSVPPPAGKSGNQRTSIRLLQSISKSFVFIKSLSIGFFCSEHGHFLSSNQQKWSLREKWKIWKFCSFFSVGNFLLLDVSLECFSRNMSLCFRMECTPQHLGLCTQNYIYN